MLNPVNGLSAFVTAIGKAFVYVATDPTTASSWSLLGLTEGDVGVDEKFNFNDFKLPEWTGDAIHARTVDGQDITVSVPLIWGDGNLYDTLNPVGLRGGGRARPTAVVTRTCLIIPVSEIGNGLENSTGLTSGYVGGAAPVHAVWIHKATFEPGQYAFSNKDAGKTLRSITVHAMYDDTRPDGQKLFTIGDPFAQGITDYRF
jgi:hypothetical protein